MKIRLQGFAAIILGFLASWRLYDYYISYTSGVETTIYLPKILIPVISFFGVEKGLLALGLLPLFIVLYGLRKMIFKIDG
ncbi:MAG: hypothetical protein KAH22_10355 [Thiotrichaceae bacterium]|nr:hypothetical protein [Thiotrichaceae bacterium]